MTPVYDIMAYCIRDITKEVVRELAEASCPRLGQVVQIRIGKVGPLAEEYSAIFKTPIPGPAYVGVTGITGDDHFYHEHGGTERAIMMYDSGHYADWREEKCPHPELFNYGGFGENIVCTNLTEDNVCVGDVYQVGEEVILEVSEPRNPCYKLNLRYKWPRALKRITRTGRVGWMLRVKRTGYISPGDPIRLVARPYPRWSCLNVKRVIQAKEVSLPLIQELTEVGPLTELVRNYACKRLAKTPKRYELVASEKVASRVKQLVLTLKEPFSFIKPEFPTFAFAQITFGDGRFSRSYSIVSGDMNRFTLGVALDDKSRGGSEYLHHRLRVGDEIMMAVGGSPKAVEDEQTC
ncbi:MAG: MOSC domain-containing protein, partial [Candidatus Binatia bacterium]